MTTRNRTCHWNGYNRLASHKLDMTKGRLSSGTSESSLQQRKTVWKRAYPLLRQCLCSLERPAYTVLLFNNLAPIVHLLLQGVGRQSNRPCQSLGGRSMNKTSERYRDREVLNNTYITPSSSPPSESKFPRNSHRYTINHTVKVGHSR